MHGSTTALLLIGIYGVATDPYNMTEMGMLENRQWMRVGILETLMHIRNEFHRECNNTAVKPVLGDLENLQDTVTAGTIDNSGTPVS